jgi:hypothetical protein
MILLAKAEILLYQVIIAWVAAGEDGILIVDKSNPSAPTLAGSYNY